MEKGLNLYHAIVAVYQELYRQSSTRTNYVYNPNLNERRMLVKFIGWLKAKYPANIDAGLLVSYFEFQFSRYVGIKTPYGKNTIMLNWLIGKKAWQAWLDRKVSHRYVVVWRVRQDFRLSLTAAFAPQKALKATKQKEDFICAIQAIEEHEKQRFYNTPKGYAYCSAMTLMWHPLSPLCAACKFASVCQKVQAVRYPYVNKLRTNLQAHGR